MNNLMSNWAVATTIDHVPGGRNETKTGWLSKRLKSFSGPAGIRRAEHLSSIKCIKQQVFSFNTWLLIFFVPPSSL